jgi:succinate dehydrogenase / fumarate reductase cytochrome b subunit
MLRQPYHPRLRLTFCRSSRPVRPGGSPHHTRGQHRGVEEQLIMPRPLSPHMSVYRMFRYTLFTSIFNRMTGLALSLGLILLVFWLMAVAGGPRAYAEALDLLSSPPAYLAYLVLIVAFSYHLVAGIRHLIWDTGHCIDRVSSRRSATLVMVASLLLIAGLIWWAFVAGGHLPAGTHPWSPAP